MFGLMRGLRSSRSLEDACACDCRFVYLSDGLEPDHATLARFRQKLGSELEDLFCLVCQEAERRGILERRGMVVDGTKVAAARSQWRKALEEAEDADALEEEAQKMVSRGQYLVGYNLQMAADMKSGLVTGYVASTNPADQIQMDSVIEASHRQSGGLPEKVVTDRGYDSSGNAHALASRGVKGFIPLAMADSRPPFRVDEAGNIRCPAGHIASKTGAKGSRYVYRIFRCAACPQKKACGVKGDRRDYTAARGAIPGARLEANARCETEEGRALLRLRGPTIERVFGHFKWNLGFRRLVLRGLKGATLEFGLLTLSYNLRKLVNG